MNVKKIIFPYIFPKQYQIKKSRRRYIAPKIFRIRLGKLEKSIFTLNLTPIQKHKTFRPPLGTATQAESTWFAPLAETLIRKEHKRAETKQTLADKRRGIRKKGMLFPGLGGVAE